MTVIGLSQKKRDGREYVAFQSDQGRLCWGVDIQTEARRMRRSQFIGESRPMEGQVLNRVQGGQNRTLCSCCFRRGVIQNRTPNKISKINFMKISQQIKMFDGSWGVWMRMGKHIEGKQKGRDVGGSQRQSQRE